MAIAKLFAFYANATEQDIHKDGCAELKGFTDNV